MLSDLEKPRLEAAPRAIIVSLSKCVFEFCMHLYVVVELLSCQLCCSDDHPSWMMTEILPSAHPNKLRRP